MRVLLLSVLAGCVCLGLVDSTAAQPKGGKPDKNTEISTTTPIAGKNIDQWIAEIPSKDRSKGENAIRTVLMFGPELGQKAVPALLAELRKNRTITIDTSIRVNIAIALGELLSHPKYAHEKQVTEGVSLLRGLLHDSQAIVKYRASQALGRIGPAAQPATKDLLTVLKDQSTWELRQAAAFALGRVAYDTKNGPPIEVLRGLFNVLQGEFTMVLRRPPDPSSQVRLTALQALTMLGRPVSKQDQEALESALDFVSQKDPENSVKIWAHMAHMSVKGMAEAKRVAAIAQLVQDKDLIVRIQAVQALGMLGKEAKTEVGALTAALNDPEQIVVNWSILALMRMAESAIADKDAKKHDLQALRAARTAVPRLEKMANEKKAEAKDLPDLAKKINEGKATEKDLTQLSKAAEAESMRQLLTSAIDTIEGRTNPPGKDNPKDNRKGQ